MKRQAVLPGVGSAGHMNPENKKRHKKIRGGRGANGARTMEPGHFTLTAARSLLADVTADCTCTNKAGTAPRVWVRYG